MSLSKRKRVDRSQTAGPVTAAASILPWVFLLLLCQPPTVSAAEASATERAEPVFWQIDQPKNKAGANAGRLYLLGSIHVGPRGGWQLPAATLARFASSNALIVEVDMQGGSPEEQDDAVLRYGLLAPGDSIKNHISPALYAELEHRVAKNGRSIANINAWKPWMVATMLLTFEIERLGYPTQAGLDLDMMARVTSDQRIVGLETMTEQLSLLGGMSASNQELMLKDILLQAEGIEAYFNELKEAWRTGDGAKLQEVLFRELEASPELEPFYERVIYGRNKTMCKRLEELLASGETLFGVVGAYHLVGTRGIPACLADKGFRVTELRDRTP